MYETHIAKTVNLDDKIKKTYFDTVFVQEDNRAHRISVHMYRGHEQVTMTGATVKGYFFMDNDTVPKEITGSMSGNVASVLLTEACYSKTGQFTLIIKVETTNETCTVLYGEGSVFSSKPYAAAEGGGNTGGGTSGGSTGGSTGGSGKDGQDGQDGYSPTVSITKITGGNRVRITDVNGTQTFDVMDGTDGISPTITTTAITGGHRVTITDANGTKSFDVMNGTGGGSGTGGYTPVRGVDYWTEADIAEIKGYVDDAILGGAW